MKMGMLMALGVLSAAALVQADSFTDVEYVSGMTGFTKKAKGTLVVEESQLRFQNKDGALIFAIPIAEVTDAVDSREHSEGSVGRKMALGIFAGKDEEFLTVKAENSASAEAVVFKCRSKTASGMAAKINFFAKRAHQTATR